jgi:hypothetical protein
VHGRVSVRPAAARGEAHQGRIVGRVLTRPGRFADGDGCRASTKRHAAPPQRRRGEKNFCRLLASSGSLCMARVRFEPGSFFCRGV